MIRVLIAVILAIRASMKHPTGICCGCVKPVGLASSQHPVGSAVVALDRTTAESGDNSLSGCGAAATVDRDQVVRRSDFLVIHRLFFASPGGFTLQ